MFFNPPAPLSALAPSGIHRAGPGPAATADPAVVSAMGTRAAERGGSAASGAAVGCPRESSRRHANAAAGSTPNAGPPASASSAAGLRRSRSVHSAGPAPNGVSPPTAPVTPGRRPRAVPAADAIPRPGAGRTRAQPPATRCRRAAGLCIRCGTRPPEEGRPMCEPCRDGRGRQTRAPSRPPRRRPLREMRGARTRRGDVSRLLRRRPDRAAAAQPGGSARGRPPALYRAARPGRLHQLRQAGPGSGRVPVLPRRRALRALFAQAARELGGVPRHPDMGTRASVLCQ